MTMTLRQIFTEAGLSAEKWVVGGLTAEGKFVRIPRECLDEEGWEEVSPFPSSASTFPYEEMIAVGRDWQPTPAPSGGFYADCVAWQLIAPNGTPVRFECNGRGSRWYRRRVKAAFAAVQ